MAFKKGIIEFCKELGCCDACCLRYVGLKVSKYYENPKHALLKFQEGSRDESPSNGEDSSKLNNNKTDNAIDKSNQKPAVADINENNTSVVNNDTKTVPGIINDTTETVNNDNDTKKSETGTINEITDIVNNDIAEKSVNIQTQAKSEIKENISNDLEDITNDLKETSNVTSLNKGDLTKDSEKIKDTSGIESPPVKRCKLNVCASCLGILQETLWEEIFGMVKEVLDKKGYECNTFACGLSSPMAIILREKAIALRIKDKFPGFDESNITPLKESWKWSFCTRMAESVNKVLDSGAVSPLLITLNYDYPDDLQELEALKTIAPQLFKFRSKHKRFHTEFTRRSVEQALEKATLKAVVSAGGGLPLATATAKCVSVACTHSPIYIAGRYLKLSRKLPQSPWLLQGKRVMPSSVQEIIFKPIADIYKFTEEEAEERLKFLAAGREDVDVRCLGEGRPFAIEITDPRRMLTSEELARVCEEIEKSGDVVVKSMVPIRREDLTALKEGEETKSKTYEALCIKLTHSKFDDVPPDAPIRVTAEDLKRINEFRNTPEGDPIKIKITQKTPIRVLHRRPLLTRTKGILELAAYEVPEHPQLFRIVVSTSAGTYVKEWASGELGRSAPPLAQPLGARAALVALDVAAVRLRWPPIPRA